MPPQRYQSTAEQSESKIANGIAGLSLRAFVSGARLPLRGRDYGDDVTAKVTVEIDVQRVPE